MRAAVLGVFFRDRPALRREFGQELARVTHVDERAVEGALYVAELAAACAGAAPEADRAALVRAALQAVSNEELSRALERALALARSESPVEGAARELGTSGYVVHTAAFATFCFIRWGHDPLAALSAAIGAGGDTDSIAAILGGWVGALHGEAGLPQDLIQRLHDGPYGPGHLRHLARALAAGGQPAPRYSAAAALVRNLALYPVIVAHGFRRLIPL